MLRFGTFASSSNPLCQGDCHVENVSDISQDGHQHIREAMGLLGIMKQGIIYLIEIRLALFLMAENLDHLLPVHHLLHKSLGFSQSDLLAHKISG